MGTKVAVFNSSDSPKCVMIEPIAEDYVLTPHETLVFVAEDPEEDFYFSIDARDTGEVLVYAEGMCKGVVARTLDGRRVEFGYNRHLNPDYPVFKK